jgi:tetratricopeptide (TPR) repeat protein
MPGTNRRFCSKPNDDRTIIRLRVLQALQTSDINERELLLKAKSLIAKKQYEKALEKLKLIDADNDYAVYANRLLGKTYALMEDYSQAEEYLVRSIEADDSSSEAYYNLGIVKYYMKQYDRAAECFKKVVSLSGDYKRTGKYLDFIERILDKKS